MRACRQVDDSRTRQPEVERSHVEQLARRGQALLDEPHRRVGRDQVHALQRVRRPLLRARPGQQGTYPYGGGDAKVLWV